MLGIFIGIAAVVALISLGQGMQKSIIDQFEGIGKNRIIVTAGGAEMGPYSSQVSVEKLTNEDAKVMIGVKGIEMAQGIIVETGRVDFGKETEYVQIFGVLTTPEGIREMEMMGMFEIGSGRDFRSSDKYVAIVAEQLAENLFDKEIRVKDSIKIKEIEFEVIGIQKRSGAMMYDSIIRIPRDTAKEIFDLGEEYSMIGARVKEGENVDEVKDNVEEELRKSRDVEENEEDFSVQTSAQMIEQINMILNVVQAVLIGIAVISLVVGGVGIMNTMYTSVLERRKEIGIMKAIGARNSDVASLFLVESGVLGLIGGATGVIIGLALSKTVEIIALKTGVVVFEALISPTLIIGALLFSFIVGAVSGFFPAKEAASMRPVDAMRL